MQIDLLWLYLSDINCIYICQASHVYYISLCKCLGLRIVFQSKCVLYEILNIFESIFATKISIINFIMTRYNSGNVTYRKSIMQPTAQLQHARLIIKWKIRDIDLTGRTKFSRRRPKYLAFVVYQCQTSHIFCSKVISTGRIYK